jgi:hypothetical protein
MKPLKKLFKTLTILVIIPLLSPWLGFVARSVFPMNKPEFKELTHYQFLEWCWGDYQRLAREERLKNPNKPMKMWGAGSSQLTMATPPAFGQRQRSDPVSFHFSRSFLRLPV